MKIKSIEVMKLEPAGSPLQTQPRRPPWSDHDEVANPLSHYPRFKPHRNIWYPKSWDYVWVKLTLEDGTWGLGYTYYGWATAGIISEFLAPNLIGEDALDIERLNDMMWRMTLLFGATGLAALAVSAIDLALWDAKGKLLQKPVWALLNPEPKEKIFCYATGNDYDWYQAIGFQAFKLACPYGPADGEAGLAKNEAFFANARAQVGPDAPLMLDCWMAFDVDYTVAITERLQPHGLHWIEETLHPEAFDDHIELRRRLPNQRLTTGEHWAHVPTYQWAIDHDVVDILQPDILWCGGLTVVKAVSELAQAAGKSVILHGGGRDPFGQHASFGLSGIPWLEYYVDTAPGVPLGEGRGGAGRLIPQDSWLTRSDEPGFGLGIDAGRLVAR